MLKKLREVRQETAAQSEMLDAKQEQLKSKCDKRLKKLGKLAKQAGSVAVPDVKELTTLCQSGTPEALVKSELAQSYLRELLATTDETPAEKRFYDYYALWIISKKLKDLKALPSGVSQLRATFGKALFKTHPDPPKSPPNDEEEVI